MLARSYRPTFYVSLAACALVILAVLVATLDPSAVPQPYSNRAHTRDFFAAIAAAVAALWVWLQRARFRR